MRTFTDEEVEAMEKAQRSEPRTFTDEEVAAFEEPQRTIINDPYEVLKMLNPVATEIAKGGLDSAKALLHAPNAAVFGGGPQIYGAARAGSEALVNPQAQDLLERYRKYRDQARGALDDSTSKAPVTSTLAGLAGGMATGKIPSNIINPGPGFLKGAGSGAVIGAGSSMLQSRNDYTTAEGITNAPADAGAGAMFGAPIGAMFGGLRNLFKSKEDVAKLAQAKFNTPRQVLEEYIAAGGDRSGKLKSARPRNEVVADVNEAIKLLNKRIAEGSKKSVNVLKENGLSLPKTDVIRVVDDELNTLLAKTKDLGFEPRPQSQEAIAYLKSLRDHLSNKANPTISTPEIKLLIQGFDQRLKPYYGQDVTKMPEAVALKKVRRGIDEILKKDNAEYRSVMENVANDSSKAKQIARALGHTENARINSLRSAFTLAEKGIGKQKRQALKDLDQLLGTDLEDKALWSHFAEQFDKTSMNGSMNQKRWAELLKNFPGGNYLAPVMGSVMDQFGRATARMSIEFYIGLQRLLKEDQQGYKKAVASLVKLAQQGNPAAAATMYIINQTNPPREK